MLTEVALCAAGLAGLALADPSATVNAPAAVTSINDNDGPSSSGTSTRQSFSGDGSVGAGWPAYSTWISFDDMSVESLSSNPRAFADCVETGSTTGTTTS